MFNITPKLESLKDDMKMLIKGFKLLNNMLRWVLPITAMTALFSSVYPFINIYMSSLIIDELTTNRKLNTLIFYVAVTITLNFTILLIGNGLSHLKDIQSNLIYNKQEMMINNKVLIMDFEHVENPQIELMRRKISECRNMCGGGVCQLLYGFDRLIKSIITILVSVFFVFNLFTMAKNSLDKGSVAIINSPLLSIILIATILASTFLTMVTNTRSSKKQFNIMDKFIPMNRMFNYYFGEYIDGYKAGKDIRIYNQKELVENEAMSFLHNGNKLFKDIGNIKGGYSSINAAISSFLSGVVYIFVGLKALIGIFSVGSLVKYTGSIYQFTNGFSQLMTSFTDLRTNNKYLKLYFDFMDIKNVKYHGTLPVEKREDNEYEIEFRNVSFKYPASEKYVLKNLSLKLHIGERLAIVGMNGSGKTTMIKLLCRLYDPTHGEILLNGIDIKKYDYKEYISIFSVVFQDFKLFSFSLGQNVATSVEFDKEKVFQCLSKAGLGKRISELPKGVDTPLYKDFDEDGVEISGGEAQKIAIARALYKDAHFIILDEPTSALDPIAEFEIYSKFNDIVGHKTAIYISHRLSSCRFCDNIAVFHQGEIIQRGSHDVLISNENGKYHQLWTAQAQYYSNETSLQHGEN
ncbi:ABC transporter ATP-binding protein [Clostridium akagii]|uniref:ABC transporter ATP-binding protein n=1 Tax=Clostridium akagii TaxID=91623 RepID=UPI00068DBD39|nr:ABC transporter ATP-binding protein [Clostridium akagii]